jgi:hypothetical protein
MLIDDANVRDAPAFKRGFLEARCLADPRAQKYRDEARENAHDSRSKP